ncbi:MAG: hypothetical protein H6767_05370 [Candidatus Peribacteria bacterium]|nr:MAG: hypothetical protein H6767_05370 [Candidatus Peribacteria bacterium]
MRTIRIVVSALCFAVMLSSWWMMYNGAMNPIEEVLAMPSQMALASIFGTDIITYIMYYGLYVVPAMYGVFSYLLFPKKQ